MSEFRPSRFEILPTMIKNLLIINGLVFLAQYTLGKTGPGMATRINDLFALHYWGSDLFRPYQLITHLFMHSTESFSHLFMNMFTLWMFGATLENVWGAKRFLIFYLICGLGAAFCHLGVLTYENINLSKDIHAYLTSPSAGNFATLQSKYDLVLGDYELNYPTTPAQIEATKVFLQQYISVYRDTATLGASGAVFGILFAFGYLFPNSLLYIYFMFPVKAKYVVGFMIVVELISGVQNSAGDNVAHFAHLGGVLFSFILLKTWNRKNRKNFY
jgi:membrane associated rhomboid family serine protease